MKIQNSAEYIVKRSAQSDVKTEQRNKQEGNLMRKNIEKIGKNAEISHNQYLRERAILMQDIKKMTIEYDLISKQYNREQKSGQMMNEGIRLKTENPADKADDVFNMLIDDGESTTGTVGGGDMDVVLDPKIRRLKLIQQEHERQLRNRLVVFHRDLEMDKQNFNNRPKPIESTEEL